MLGGMIRIILVGGVRGGVITMDIMIPVSIYVMYICIEILKVEVVVLVIWVWFQESMLCVQVEPYVLPIYLMFDRLSRIHYV